MNQDLRHGTSTPNSLLVSVREFILLTAIACGVAATLITEILSVFSLITSGWLWACWSLGLLLFIGCVLRFRKSRRLRARGSSFSPPFPAILLLSGLILIVTLTGVMA